MNEIKNIGALIPIRLASERLPKKALLEICNRPVVWHLLDRVCASRYIEKEQVVVCTTKEAEDDALVKTVEQYGCSVFRGSTDDIIKRFYDTIIHYHFDAVIQVDGDDILCDTLYMDLTMETLLADSSLGIVLSENLPFGINSKSFTKEAMDRVFDHYKTEKNDTGFIYYFTKTGLCKQKVVRPLKPIHILDKARLTLDYQLDFDVFKAIFEALYVEGEIFGLEEVIRFLKANPDVMKTNSNLDEEYWQLHQSKSQFLFKDEKGNIQKIK